MHYDLAGDLGVQRIKNVVPKWVEGTRGPLVPVIWQFIVFLMQIILLPGLKRKPKEVLPGTRQAYPVEALKFESGGRS